MARMRNVESGDLGYGFDPNDERRLSELAPAQTPPVLPEITPPAGPGGGRDRTPPRMLNPSNPNQPSGGQSSPGSQPTTMRQPSPGGSQPSVSQAPAQPRMPSPVSAAPQTASAANPSAGGGGQASVMPPIPPPALPQFTPLPSPQTSTLVNSRMPGGLSGKAGGLYGGGLAVGNSPSLGDEDISQLIMMLLGGEM